MRIAYLTAGAAGMYCGSCLHDNTLARALIRLGHDVTLVPTYTPIRTDETDVSADRVFYGAINVYLEEKFALFRHTPWLVDRLLGGRRLLGWVSRLAGSTDARALGSMTHSVLLGEEGRQAKELRRLVAWLGEHVRPEIVHITNSMLVGLAAPLRRELGTPVVCSVQGEDLFLDELNAPWRSRVLELLRRRARDVDAFVACSGYYAEHMGRLLDLPAERVHTVPLGLDLDGHGEGSGPAGDGGFVIGYLARLCPEKGLHLLADAFRRLAAEPGREVARLRVAGYLGARDRDYVARVRAGLERAGLAERVEFVGEVDRAGKLAFLDSLHVLSVPAVYREPKGLYVLEALANGVPVVEPRHGAFPELIERTGGGVLVEPGSSMALAAALAALMDDDARRRRLGAAGREAVHRDAGTALEARRTLALYERLRGRGHSELTSTA